VIVESLTNQATFVKKLDTMARVNENYIAKISTKFKVIVNMSYERFQQTA